MVKNDISTRNINYESSSSNKNFVSANSGLDIKDLPNWLIKANFSRTETDLIATKSNSNEVIFLDFFTHHELPGIYTKNGLFLNGNLLKNLAGQISPLKYAQAQQTNDATLSIGEISTIKGEAIATRVDGNQINLNQGDPVFKGDVIETIGNGSVGLVFLDKTTLSLSDGGKMVLDELVYDPNTGNGSMVIDMVEGAFSFVSGEIAKTGPDAMSVSTPVATIGIRGTTVAGKAALEGNENSFTLLQDADGGVGTISVSNAGGTQTLSQIGATTSIASFSAPPPPPIILSASQIQANYGTALAVLPPTPVVAPQPQPQPESQQEEQQVQDILEEQDQNESFDEEVVEEETVVEGEEGDGAGGELGPDGEPLPEGEGELGPDVETLPEDGAPPVGPDGEPLPPGERGPPIGPDGEPLPAGEGDPGLGLDGGDQSLEQDAAAREAFETAMADGATPEEAMAAAAAEGFDGFIPGGGPGDFIPGGSEVVGEGDLFGEIGDEGLFGGPEGSGDLFGAGPAGGPGGPDDLFRDGPGDFGNPPGGTGIELGGPGYLDGPMEFGDPTIGMPGGEGLGGSGSFDTGPSGFVQNQFTGAQPPGAASFAPLGQPTNFAFGPDPIGQANMGFAGGGYRPGGFDGGTPGGGFAGAPVGYAAAGSGGFGVPLAGGFSIFDHGFSGFGPNFGNIIEDEAYNDPYFEDFYDDPSLYSNYYENTSDSSSNSSSSTFSGTGSDDTMNYNTYTSSVTLKGFSGDDILYGGNASDILFGGLGDDNLTGNGGSDQFYLITGDGNDTIADFTTSDFFVYGGSMSSAYTRTTFSSYNASSGSSYNLSSNSNELPYVFNFTNNISGHATSSTVANTLSSFKVTTDGSTAITSSDSYLVVSGDGTNSSVYLWEDGGNGAISSSELTSLATLSNFDNDTLTGTEFSFTTLSV